MPAGKGTCTATGCMAGIRIMHGFTIDACPYCRLFEDDEDVLPAVAALLGTLLTVYRREGKTVADALDTVVDRAEATVLYVVTGRTGEYDDEVEWPVRACPKEVDARALVERLTAWCNMRGLGEEPTSEWDRAVLPPEDHGFRWNHTGTRYVIVEVMLDTPVTGP